MSAENRDPHPPDRREFLTTAGALTGGRSRSASDRAIDYLGGTRVPGSAAGRNQAVAFVFGTGKVVVLGEAAMLFNLDHPLVQNRQFSLNLLRWLAGRLETDVAKGCATS